SCIKTSKVWNLSKANLEISKQPSRFGFLSCIKTSKVWNPSKANLEISKQPSRFVFLSCIKTSKVWFTFIRSLSRMNTNYESAAKRFLIQF
ncbi:MAG: hypothetical protein KKG93_14340, partial [Bacteroidetes bacterium]|nr:hypothetical protein [Bacteroidota bacterium]